MEYKYKLCIGCHKEILNAHHNTSYCNDRCRKFMRKRKPDKKKLIKLLTMEGEIYYPVINYEDNYMVSNLGRVLNIIKFKYMKRRGLKNGSYVVYLTQHKKIKGYHVNNLKSLSLPKKPINTALTIYT